GLREALALGAATGTSPEAVLDMLGGTGLAFLAGMKGPFVRGERTTEGGDFTADAIAKDARLMLDTVAAADGPARPGSDLPALRGALASLDAEIAAGHGDDDFSTILLQGAPPTDGWRRQLPARPRGCRPWPVGRRRGSRRGGCPRARCARALRRRRSRSPHQRRRAPSSPGPGRRGRSRARRGSCAAARAGARR